MIYYSISFFVFFAFLVFIYYAIPVKVRYIWLLIVSYVFYLQFGAKFSTYIIIITIWSYICGRMIEYIYSKKHSATLGKLVLICGFCFTIGILVIVKYSNLFIGYSNKILSLCKMEGQLTELDILIPVGLSFYTLQAFGYIYDVYKRKYVAEKNILKYALFISFFPIVASGPIERGNHLLKQISEKKYLDVENLRYGLLSFMWGIYLKLVVADNLAIAVNNVIDHYTEWKGCEIVIATILYGIQIYCDFWGYSEMAVGVAKMLGFDIIHNFRAPYLSGSVKEFWRRWHISLTSWFTDYLYIPLGGNRKGVFRKYVNIMIVFGVSGLWHGAGLKYLVWGLLNGFYLVMYDIYSRFHKAKEVRKGRYILNCIITFLVIDFAWFFFMMPGLSEAMEVFRYMVTNFHISKLFIGGIVAPFDGKWQLFIFAISMVLIIFFDYLEIHKIDFKTMILKQEAVVRWMFYIFILMTTIVCGVYGNETGTAAQFIYSQF